MNIYAIKDIGCGLVHIFTASNDFAAMRAVSMNMQNNPNDMITKYSKDFELFNVGEINVDNAEITNTEKKHVANLNDLKEKNNG